jgi:hypothetical protein
MFKLGGDTVTAQGTGITSGLDVPRQGYADPNDKVIPLSEQLSGIDVGVPEATRKRAFWSGIGQGFGSNPKTLGEALSGSVAARDQILGPAEAQAGARKFELEKTGVMGEFDRETAELIQTLQNTGALNVAKVANAFENTVTGGSIKVIEARKDLSREVKNKMIQEVIMRSDTPQMIVDVFKSLVDNATAQMEKVDPDKAAEQAAAIVGSIVISAGLSFAKGGRAGYQFGTPNTGAMPMQASATEEIVTPNADITATETVTEGPQPTVQMSYQEFRAAIPAEVNDEIVQLIYYNEDAFADFSQITSQADIYTFNNKYGVSLVLPMDTETT